MKTNIKIEHPEIETEFLEHLSISDNKRVLFSAPFGTGKSTFLQHLFSSEAASSFIPLTLYPINYSVAANEDVFELIKFDLLLELLTRYKDEIEITEEEFGILFAGEYYIYDKLRPRNLLSTIIGLGEKIGKPVFAFLKILKETVDNIQEFKKEIETGEDDLISKYIQESEKKQGSPNEMDDVSFLIFTLISRLVTKKSTKDKMVQSVLIIDDLDRLDPDHIFRLFNIFSSHYDTVSDNNKFGFEKVLFVCDIDNIKKIYHHKYGHDVDFSGYIDKFYSKDIFRFNNIRFIKENVRKLFAGYQTDVTKTHIRHRLDTRNSDFYEAFSWIIFTFLEAKEMNLRVLIHKEKLVSPQHSFYISNSHREHHALNHDFLVMMHYLKSFFASEDAFTEKLKRISERFNAGFNPLTRINSSTYDQEIAERCILHIILPFLLPQKDGFVNDRPEIESNYYRLPEFESMFYYTYESSDNMRNYAPRLTRITKIETAEDYKPNIFKLLYFTYIKVRKEGLLE